ncbi:HU family DNA-binding protein [Pseudomonas aeruginosa]|uniref:HU family DNA-binding protein n=1 Tax=Pseudomonas aeruginosa TaxID=287 RepID=UPI000BB6D1B0|nr:HU family DNA-binding protein [Pseudomonas aeruginosa]AXR09981.1 HU family DNA-binding protein [Pseudomonas aeruginosa]EIU2598519.1 HU family DNA-binding protein [Pseudomonas aeruginosa]EIU2879819.1 HU family DNA-binding protein [Pseudomonas aeruginosa]ELC7283636.1 HU family DNA-binding protein [Pseudomonas aeruginosa]ELK4865860.1 HU family DNA-binding protein [Pseudomonas aeruginosa]
MSMTKQALIDSIHDDLQATGTPVSKHQVNAVLERLGSIATAQLKNGGDVPLPGLGKLKAGQRAARTGRNPATGAAIDIPAKTIVKLATSKALEDTLNT